MVALYIPPNAQDNFDQKHANNNDWKDQDAVQDNSLLLRRKSVQALFKQYNYDKQSMVHCGTTVGSKKFSSMMVDTQGKADHDSFMSCNKKVHDLISWVGTIKMTGDKNDIEEQILEKHNLENIGAIISQFNTFKKKGHKVLDFSNNTFNCEFAASSLTRLTNSRMISPRSVLRACQRAGSSSSNLTRY